MSSSITNYPTGDNQNTKNTNNTYNTEEMPQNQKKQNKVLFTLMVIIVIALATISIIGMVIYKSQPMEFQGQIEAEQIKISGKLLGRVEKFYVCEGDVVKKGDTLVLINSPEVKAMLQSASAMENVAAFQDEKVDKGARSEIIGSLKEALNAAEANYKLALSTNKRIEQLYKDSVATLQRKEETNTLLQNAKAAMEAANYQYKMALKGAEKEDKESAKALVNAAKGNVNQVSALLVDSKLTAPSNGEISSIFPTQGELVLPGTSIMNLVNLDDCHVVINIKEDYLENFKIGSEFIGKVPALGNKEVKFKIYYINPLGSYATWQSTKKTGSYNVITFQIKAKPLNNENNKLQLRPGMSVITTGPK